MSIKNLIPVGLIIASSLFLSACNSSSSKSVYPLPSISDTATPEVILDTLQQETEDDIFLDDDFSALEKELDF